MDLLRTNIEHVSEREFHSFVSHQSVALTTHHHYDVFVMMLLQGRVAALGYLEIAHVEAGGLSGFAGEDPTRYSVPTLVLRFVFFGLDMVPVEASEMSEELGDVGRGQRIGIGCEIVG